MAGEYTLLKQGVQLKNHRALALESPSRRAPFIRTHHEDDLLPIWIQEYIAICIYSLQSYRLLLQWKFMTRSYLYR